LAIAHHDPFDRMLMAQAELENIPILTYDRVFFDCPARVIPTPPPPPAESDELV